MRVTIAIIFCLLIADIFIRVVSPSLSGNIAHIQEFRAITQALSTKQAESDNTILFLGNSLTANAVNVNQFENELRANGTENTFAYKVVPDGTSFWDWYCIAKNSFVDAQVVPKTLVIGFAWGSESPTPSRLATHFCGITDLPVLINLGMNSTSEIVEYLLASFSKLYALRETIHKRLLDKLIPHYQQYTQEANSLNRANEVQGNSQSPPKRNQALMSRFLNMLTENNIETVFIAMPVITPYSIDRDLAKSMQLENTYLYDYRKLEGVSSDMFLDPIHLNSEGSRVFTKRLAQDFNNRSNP